MIATYAYAIVHNYFTPSTPNGNVAVLDQQLVAGVPGPYTTVAATLSSFTGPGAQLRGLQLHGAGVFNLAGTAQPSSTP